LHKAFIIFVFNVLQEEAPALAIPMSELPGPGWAVLTFPVGERTTNFGTY